MVSADHSTFTILGAGGFIGAALVAWLESHDHVVHAVTRAALPALLAARRPAGHVIDCIGLTGDFRVRPLDTAEAHVGLVARCLAELQFDSFLLLSSTRVYARAERNARGRRAAGAARRSLRPLQRDEARRRGAVSRRSARRRSRVVRLSNVYGIGMPAETFLGQVLREGRATGGVVFRQSPASAKDYVSIAAVVRLLPAIAATRPAADLQRRGRQQHQPRRDRLLPAATSPAGAPASQPTLRRCGSPPIDTARLDGEFGPTASDLVADLPTLLALAQEHQCSPSTRPMAA